MENHLESYTIKGYNLNSLVYDGIQRLYEKGQKQQTRNGEVLFLNEIDFILINPKARHLNLKGGSGEDRAHREAPRVQDYRLW